MMRFGVLHGHFYQPPREEPWLEFVPREPSATPWHDWNERITAECYAPLCRAPVLDADGRIVGARNAYEWCSFDVGPTLFRWLDRHAPAVAHAIVAADRASATRIGHGNAVAAPYHHIILPLASRRDKITEVRWGMRDFRARFGREPVGMWLPETAVDDETLEVLADEGIRFTILSPHQVTSPGPDGHAGRWTGARGQTLAIFTYDASLSNDIAFTELMRDPAAVERRYAHDAPVDRPTIMALATDGETFGHHHARGDAALAAIIDHLDRSDRVTLTNFEALLAAYPPSQAVSLHAPSSWSCSHGIERWRSDCGCRMDPATSQAWRAPLRDGLQALNDGIVAVVEREWPADAGELWQARDAAGAELEGASQFSPAARRLLEAAHHALAMFTSCGWFFDDIGRIEPRLILRHAARALDFLPHRDRTVLEGALLATLATAHSNDPAKGSGLDIWNRDVLREADGPARLAAGIAALRELAPAALDELDVPSHEWRFDGDQIITVHRRTGRELMWAATPIVEGVVADRVHVRQIDSGIEQIVSIDQFPPPVRMHLDAMARPIVYDATLDASVRELLAEGGLDAAAARRLALEGAWATVGRDGLDRADVLVHAAIDLYRLAETAIPAELRIAAYDLLMPLPPSRSRSALAERFAVRLEDAA